MTHTPSSLHPSVLPPFQKPSAANQQTLYHCPHDQPQQQLQQQQHESLRCTYTSSGCVHTPCCCSPSHCLNQYCTISQHRKRIPHAVISCCLALLCLSVLVCERGGGVCWGWDMWGGGWGRLGGGTVGAEAAAVSPAVTYGSAISLKHQASNYKLFSGRIAWGSGSGQQAVTAIGGDEYDDTVMWYVKSAEINKIPPPGASSQLTSTPTPGAHRETYGAGTAVKCGAVVSLEHVDSEKNLHSHSIKSPISGQFEVSAYGEKGVGNEGDNFIVQCLDGDKEVWRVNSVVALRHRGMGGYLKASISKRFNRENCPRCPIEGHLEVVIGQDVRTKNTPPNEDEKWRAVDGVLVSLSELDEDEAGQDDEL
eukprot:GHVQ01018385.1.p1 GENE.GHVQ01018385.1~~GHVQ01018385.1.p1  ORF type:complete len:366 (-),score=72.83 GHVQ01018385.1:1710-2807(-)